MSELPTHGDVGETAMSRIQVELDVAIRSAEREMQRVDRNMAEIRKRDLPLTDEQVRAVEKLATGPHAPREWDVVRARIARGELTWRDIVDGRMGADPQVAAALHASVNMGKQQPNHQGPGENPAEVRAPAAARPARRPAAWDDEDFSNDDYFE
jgi:hypothetical protein